MSQQTLWNFDTTISPNDVLLSVPREGLFTRLMAARAMKRAKSPNLVKILTEMVERNYLTVQLIALPNGVDMYAYELTDLGRLERYELLAGGKLG